MRRDRTKGFAAAALAALVLAGCQSGGAPAGTAAGASGPAVAYLAGIRASAGLPALRPDPVLERAAIRQAGYMARAGRMAHDTGWRRDFAARMRTDGVATPAAENIAHGRMDMARLFETWMDSAGHRGNMLDPRFGRYGLAHAAAGDGQRYWALVLGN